MSEVNSSIPSSTLEYYHSAPAAWETPLRQRYWLHTLLLVVTCFTTLVVGARLEFNFLNNLPPFAFGNEVIPFFKIGWILERPSRLLLGIPFSATLLTILLAHEMGHYLLCRYYGVRATLPFFIPAPTLIGTFGAVIRIKGPIRSRAALFDIGIAGPIAGFVAAVITLAIAMTLSKPLSPGAAAADLRLGFPGIFYVVQHAVREFFPSIGIGTLPLSRIYLHPTAIAAWVGMFATALNLLPSGQLDGGHIVYALLPRSHRTISWATVAVLVLLSLKYTNWWVWAGLLFLMNVFTQHQRQAPSFPDVPTSRWPLALLAGAMLALTFMLSPLEVSLK